MGKLGAVIFDFDGTIADSEPLHLEAFQEVLSAEAGRELTEAEYYERYLAYDDKTLFEEFFRDRGEEIPAEELARLLALKAERYEARAENPRIFPGAAEMVRSAAARWPLAIASGARGAEVRSVLERAGLLRCFSAIVTAEMVRRGKPDPEGFLLALERLNEAREGEVPPGGCLVVEDSIHGVEGARAAGMRVLAVTTSYPRAQLATAHRVVDSLEEAADAESLERWFRSLG